MLNLDHPPRHAFPQGSFRKSGPAVKPKGQKAKLDGTRHAQPSLSLARRRRWWRRQKQGDQPAHGSRRDTPKPADFERRCAEYALANKSAPFGERS